MRQVPSWKTSDSLSRRCRVRTLMPIEAAATSTAGELLALSGPRNPYKGPLGVIEEGALADILVVDGNPLEDIMVLGASKEWFGAPTPEPIETMRLIMKDGKIYKNTIAAE